MGMEDKCFVDGVLTKNVSFRGPYRLSKKFLSAPLSFFKDQYDLIQSDRSLARKVAVSV